MVKRLLLYHYVYEPIWHSTYIHKRSQFDLFCPQENLDIYPEHTSPWRPQPSIYCIQTHSDIFYNIKFTRSEASNLLPSTSCSSNKPTPPSHLSSIIPDPAIHLSLSTLPVQALVLPSPMINYDMLPHPLPQMPLHNAKHAPPLFKDEFCHPFHWAI